VWHDGKRRRKKKVENVPREEASVS